MKILDAEESLEENSERIRKYLNLFLEATEILWHSVNRSVRQEILSMQA